MGGGHSPITPSYGLAVDFVTELYLVDSNASVIHVTNTSQDSNIRDLFWAIRGGGGSTFGVVVNITFKTHDPPNNKNNNNNNNNSNNYNKNNKHIPNEATSEDNNNKKTKNKHKNKNKNSNDNSNVFTGYYAAFIMYTDKIFSEVFNGILNYTANYLDSNVGGYLMGELSSADPGFPIISFALLFPYDLEYAENSINTYFLNNPYINSWKAYSNFTTYNTFWEYQQNVYDANYYRNYVWNDFIPAKNLTANFTNVVYNAFETSKEQLKSGIDFFGFVLTSL